MADEKKIIAYPGRTAGVQVEQKPPADEPETAVVDAPATEAEAAEAARFRALTAARAARQAMLRRIMAELAELDEFSPAA